MPFPFKHYVRRGEKYIVIENGKPEYVVMHYDDYREMIDRTDQETPRATSSEMPQYEMPAAKTVSQDNFGTHSATFVNSQVPQDISKIRLEDLPL